MTVPPVKSGNNAKIWHSRNTIRETFCQKPVTKRQKYFFGIKQGYLKQGQIILVEQKSLLFSVAKIDIK
jgi:hypothetical protein